MGRVVRPGRDPQWLDTDRGYALAWSRNKSETCPHCGTRPDEWAEARGLDDELEPYEADTHFCRGCQLLAEEAQALPKGEDGRHMPGFKPYLRRPSHGHEHRPDHRDDD
jgi:hypothetical protein